MRDNPLIFWSIHSASYEHGVLWAINADICPSKLFSLPDPSKHKNQIQTEINAKLYKT